MNEEEKPVGKRVRIVNFQDYPSRRDGRSGKLDRVITYTVDAEGPFHLIIAEEKYSWDSFLEKVREKEETREKILGRTGRL